MSGTRGARDDRSGESSRSDEDADGTPAANAGRGKRNHRPTFQRKDELKDLVSTLKSEKRVVSDKLRNTTHELQTVRQMASNTATENETLKNDVKELARQLERI